jgi:hypothetical protein
MFGRVVRRLGPRRAWAFGLAVVLVVGAAVASGTDSVGPRVELAAAKAGSAVAQPSAGTVTITDSGNWTINLTSGPGAIFGYIKTARSDYHYRATETIRIPACAVSRPGTTGCLATAADHSSPPAVVVGSPTLTASGSANSTLVFNAPASDAIPCNGQVQALPVSIGSNPNLVNAPIQVHFALHEMWVYVAPPQTWVTISGETPPDVTPATECPPLGGHSILQWHYGPVTDLNKVLPKTFTYGPPSPGPGESETGSSTITIAGSACSCCSAVPPTQPASGETWSPLLTRSISAAPALTGRNSLESAAAHTASSPPKGIDGLNVKDLTDYVKVGVIGLVISLAPHVTYDKQGNAMLTYNLQMPIKKVQINGLFKAKFSLGMTLTWVQSHNLGNTYPGSTAVYHSFKLELAKKGYGVKSPVPSCPLPKGFKKYAKQFQAGVTGIEDYVGKTVPMLERALFDYAATTSKGMLEAWGKGLEKFGAWIRGEQQ